MSIPPCASHTVNEEEATTTGEALPSRIAEQRETFVNSYFWLGKEKKSCLFRWEGTNGKIRLYTLESIKAYEEAREDPIYRTISPLPDEVDNLSMIVKVLKNDFNFASCGSWDGPTEEAITFADIHLSFAGVSPSHPILAADFRNMVRNIKEIMYRAREATGDTWPSSFKTRCTANSVIKFKHRLFERLSEGSPNNIIGRAHLQKWRD